MTQYHFHIRLIDGRLALDSDGVDLPSLEAAREEARQAVGDLLRNEQLGGLNYAGCSFEVFGEDGRRVLTVPVAHEQEG